MLADVAVVEVTSGCTAGCCLLHRLCSLWLRALRTALGWGGQNPLPQERIPLHVYADRLDCLNLARALTDESDSDTLVLTHLIASSVRIFGHQTCPAVRYPVAAATGLLQALPLLSAPLYNMTCSADA